MSPSTLNERPPVTDVTPELLGDWLDADDAVVIDVREDFEHATEKIPGSVHVPLRSMDPQTLREAHGPRRAVFICRTGRRSAEAAQKYRVDDERVFHLAGGIEAWKAAGQSVERSASAPRIDVMRQVQMTAGGLVLLGVLLGTFVSPWFLILSGFVGAGLMFAGASGWCGMALLLARMPWNRSPGAACGTTCGTTTSEVKGATP